MSSEEKLLYKLISGSSDQNFHFHDVVTILNRLGFVCRIRGDHYIFCHESIDEIINIQPKGSMAKPYQVKQVRSILIRYNMIREE